MKNLVLDDSFHLRVLLLLLPEAELQGRVCAGVK